MELNLKKRPQGPVIIEGFPGFGLIGTIATEFLIEHLKCELIGKHWFEEMMATIAIHEGKIVNPLNIYYCEEKNYVIVHAITAGQGTEWKIADFVNRLASELNASEIISLEGVGSPTVEDAKTYYITTDPSKEEHLKNIGLQNLNEGIIMGVTSALLLKSEKPITALFAETQSELPDSNAAAKIIEVLAKYLGLELDTSPLHDQAKKFEAKLKQILSQSEQAKGNMQKKQLSYVG